MSYIEINVPDIGDFEEVTVIELMVKVGDSVKIDQSLITVESDKASMEIPSSHAGIVKEIRIVLGDKVKQGSLVLLLDSIEEKSSAIIENGIVAAVNIDNALNPPLGNVIVGAKKVIDIRVPDIGDFTDVSVIEILVNLGDTIKKEQSLITVESDKAAMEIPSSTAGVLADLKVKIGDKINVGDLIATLEVVGSSSATLKTQEVGTSSSLSGKEIISKLTPAEPVIPTQSPQASVVGLPHASPSVRKYARILGVPLNELKGSGLKGRITEEDVQIFTRSVMTGEKSTGAISSKGAVAPNNNSGLGLLPWPLIDFSKFGEIERQSMSRIKRISGANLLRNSILIPAVTNHDVADITDLEAFRVLMNKENEKASIKVTMLAFIIKACVAALKRFPDFNSSIDGDDLIYKKYYHIGFAADTPNGLMVPVLKDVDKKGIIQISTEMSDLAKKARDGKLSPSEMTGASFTISSLGGIGGRYFTPIINAPEVAILGISKSMIEPVWDGEKFVPRLMLPLSLTWDHRVIDGASAARFNVYLGQILSDFRRVLL